MHELEIRNQIPQLLLLGNPHEYVAQCCCIHYRHLDNDYVYSIALCTMYIHYWFTVYEAI